MLRAIKRLRSRRVGEFETSPWHSSACGEECYLYIYIYPFRPFRVSCRGICNMKPTALYLPLGVLVVFHVHLAGAKSRTGGTYEISWESNEGLKEVEISLNETLKRMKERLAADLLFQHKVIQAEFAVRGRAFDDQVMS